MLNEQSHVFVAVLIKATEISSQGINHYQSRYPMLFNFRLDSPHYLFHGIPFCERCSSGANVNASELHPSIPTPGTKPTAYTRVPFTSDIEHRSLLHRETLPSLTGGDTAGHIQGNE